MVALRRAGGFRRAVNALVRFNVRTGGTFISLSATLGRSYYGVEQFTYLQNLATRFGQVGALFREPHFWYRGGIRQPGGRRGC